MSANLQDRASWEAGLGMIWKQAFRRVPKIPVGVSLHGKTAVVTGASGGLGLECARQFLQLGVEKLILAVRSQSKGDSAAAKLLAEHPAADIKVWILDMESDDSVRDFATCCKALERLDIVVLNAGCGKQKFVRCSSGKGREVTLQVNYLATMLLTLLLVPILKAKAEGRSPGRLTIVGSDMAFSAKLDQSSGSILDSMDAEKGFHGLEQYGKTKLLVPMFVSKLAETVGPDGIIINVVNPSATRGTGLMRESKGEYLVQAMVYTAFAILGRSVVDATRQYLHATLVLGKESHGSFTDWEIRP